MHNRVYVFSMTHVVHTMKLSKHTLHVTRQWENTLTLEVFCGIAIVSKQQ